ncbi:MAG TPA: ribosome maturation factor [Saprospiraceae bacterium]|nr:ribosome maturation factor [Saprospiraceae bacterium]HMQ83130.1 ribosome maturation factor [Saprospiraceae bacterium]
MIEAQIANLLELKFQEAEFTDCFLIELKLLPGNKLEVFIDSDSGITFEKCHKVSRYLEKHLDENLWLGDKYMLDVSSPGVGRPLKLSRQYAKNIGRKIEVRLEDGTLKEGILLRSNEEGIVLEEKVRVKEGNRKKTQVLETEIPFSLINKTIVKISF